LPALADIALAAFKAHGGRLTRSELLEALGAPGSGLFRPDVADALYGRLADDVLHGLLTADLIEGGAWGRYRLKGVPEPGYYNPIA